MCGALEPRQLAELSKYSVRKNASSGKELYSAAEKANGFSNILSGVVKLSKTLSDGRQQIVSLQFPPDFLGRPFRAESTVTAEAVTEVVLCSLPQTAVERMIAESPSLEHHLYQQSLRELDEARELMVTLGRKTAEEKVASFLMMIARHLDPAGHELKSAAFDLPLTRADIADYLGLTIETVSRQLTKLRSGNIIQIINSHHVIVPNMARLAARAGN
jgi:CRP/FNR family transcriptional regulator